MSTISYSKAKTLILARMREFMESLPASERTRPRYIIDFKPYSILQLIAEVERNTEVGRSYVFDQARQLGYVVSD